MVHRAHRPSSRLVLPVMLALIVSGGCVRWYESYPEDRDGSGPGVDAVKPPPPPPATVNQAHDTCSTAKVIDASTIPAAGLVLTVDHSKAQFDHETLCNSSLPDLVLKLINLTPAAKITLLCSGGHGISYQYMNSVCPLGAGSCQLGNCVNWSSNYSSAASTRYIVIARAKTAPNVTLTLLVK